MFILIKTEFWSIKESSTKVLFHFLDSNLIFRTKESKNP